MTAPLTLTAYAKLRGVSVKSVSIAVRDRRLVASVGRDEQNRPTIVDPELADREWEANTRRAAAPRAAPDLALAARLAAAAAARPAPEPTAQPQIIDLRDPRGLVPAFNVSRDLRAAAAARREAAAADLAELELAAKRGKLVDADQARADVVNRYSLVKTRLLAVPTALGQRLPDLAARVVPVVDELLREALKELSADGRGNGA